MSKLVEITIGNNTYTFVNRYQNCRDGFNHHTEIFLHGSSVMEGKAHYINRTWESYDFQSVMIQVVQNMINREEYLILSEEKRKSGRKKWKREEKEEFFAKSARIAEYNLLIEHLRTRREDHGLGFLAGIMALGDILCPSQEEANAWKLRMMKAGTPKEALMLPDDWGELPEEEKARRLNACIKYIK